MKIQYTIFKTTEETKTAEIENTDFVCVKHYDSSGNFELTAFVNSCYVDNKKIEKHKITIASGNYIEIALFYGSIELQVQMLLGKNYRNKIIDRRTFDVLLRRNKYFIELLNKIYEQNK